MITIEEALDRILALVGVLPAEEKPPLDALGQVLDEDVAASLRHPAARQHRHGRLRGARRRHRRRQRGRRPDELERHRRGRRRATSTTASVAPWHRRPHHDRRADPAPAPTPSSPSRRPTSRDRPPGHRCRRCHRPHPQGGPPRRQRPPRRRGRPRRRPRRPPRRRAPPAGDRRLASLGRDRVRVIRRPVVAVLSTGDELLEPGAAAWPGADLRRQRLQHRRAGPALGGVPRLLGIARDTVEDLTAKIHEGLDADMLVTSAGVSRGRLRRRQGRAGPRGRSRVLDRAHEARQAARLRRVPARRPPRPAHRPARQPRQLDGRLRAVRPARNLQDDGQDATPAARSSAPSPRSASTNRRRPPRATAPAAIVTERDGRYYARLPGRRGRASSRR